MRPNSATALECRLRGGPAWWLAALMLAHATAGAQLAPASATPKGPEGRVFLIGSAPVDGAKKYDDLGSFNASAGCLRGGDRVLLEAGRTFSGSLKLVPCGGATGGTIEVRSVDARGGLDAHASAMARIDGAVDAASRGLAWTKADRRDAPAGVPELASGLALYRIGPLKDEGVAELYIGGARQVLARAPNEPDEADRGRYFPASAIEGSGAGCAGAGCLRTTDARAAEAIRRIAAAAGDSLYAVVRSSAWSLSSSPIASVDAAAGEIRLAQPLTGEGLPARTLPRPGFGFVLLGAPALLDHHGEWFFDERGRMLYLVWGTAPPAASDTAIVLRAGEGAEAGAGISYVGGAAGPAPALELSGVTVAHTAGAGIRVSNAAAARLVDVAVEQVGQNAIVLADIGGTAQVLRAHVRDAADNGLLLRSVRQAVVRDSRFSAVGQLANQRRFGMDMNGIRASGFGSLAIVHNEIAGVGFAGIMLAEPAETGAARLQVEVADNRIDGFCQRLNDCGAIYVNGRDKAVSPDVGTGDKRIVGNVIAAPGGEVDGTPGGQHLTAASESERRTGAFTRYVAAVYLDHRASGYDVSGNRITGRYEPNGWRMSNGGLMNACSRAEARRCVATGSSAYRCYTASLEGCNSVPPPGAERAR